MARFVSRHPRILLITALLLIAATLFALLHGISLPVPDRSQKTAEETSAFHGSNRDPESNASRISVPYISQENLLLTGCELVSAVMLLRFEGCYTSVYDFADAIPKQELYTKEGLLYGPHPDSAFVGDPYSSSGYGCYAPVVAETLNRFLPSGRQASASKERTLSDLADRCTEEGQPALIWATMNMHSSSLGTWWILPSGEKFQWTSGEHCLVLLGADDSFYYFNDPYESHGQVAYSRTLVEQRYRELGCQSVIIIDED